MQIKKHDTLPFPLVEYVVGSSCLEGGHATSTELGLDVVNKPRLAGVSPLVNNPHNRSTIRLRLRNSALKLTLPRMQLLPFKNFRSTFQRTISKALLICPLYPLAVKIVQIVVPLRVRLHHIARRPTRSVDCFPSNRTHQRANSRFLYSSVTRLADLQQATSRSLSSSTDRWRSPSW